MSACEKCWAEATSRAVVGQCSVQDVYDALVRSDWCKQHDRDLTPAEARAEIEAFMGEGWIAKAATDGLTCVVSARHYPSDIVLNALDHRTFRAAVDALKQAWRDAVRPWLGYALSQTSLSREEKLRVAENVLGEEV